MGKMLRKLGSCGLVCGQALQASLAADAEQTMPSCGILTTWLCRPCQTSLLHCEQSQAHQRRALLSQQGARGTAGVVSPVLAAHRQPHHTMWRSGRQARSQLAIRRFWR